jgi:hypothetical protein
MGRSNSLWSRREPMNDLLSRLDQIEGVIRALGSDARRLRESCSRLRVPVEFDSEAAGVRRQYVRAVFALIEAVVEQHRRLLVDLLGSGVISLDSGMAQNLASRHRHGLSAVYKAAAAAFGQSIDVACVPLKDAKGVRNRLTHPKSFEECRVCVLDLDKVDEAEEWFRQLNNKFVRVAKDHQRARRW